jgi:hypothetical protein
MLQEIDDQTAFLISNQCPDIVVTPVGVGSLAQAVDSHYKRSGNHNSTKIITVEPDTAVCLKVSLKRGDSRPLVQVIPSCLDYIVPLYLPLLGHYFRVVWILQHPFRTLSVIKPFKNSITWE